MKNSRNTLILVGRIGQDAEKVELENGKSVIKFSLATPNNYLNQNGEKVERVDWHYCEIWKNSNKARIAEYLTKGTLVSLSAQLRYNSYIILAHNHPSGNLRPSQADIQLTRKLVASGKLLFNTYLAR